MWRKDKVCNMVTKKVDLSKPVQTRSGLKVRLLCTDRKDPYPIVGLISRPASSVEGARESLEVWRLDGSYLDPLKIEHPLDLVNAPVRIETEIWVNVYRDLVTRDLIFCAAHDTRKQADDHGCPNRFACVKVHLDVEEGQGL